ncbi:MAG: hypothetical protein H7Z19_04970 [Chitinophagaceae bacterium]|nr:hypothetical protein [Rubrivivax sp.]
MVEDVEWIIGTDSAERIAERVGLTLEALERALYRADRRDLWHRIKAGMPANLHTSTKAA